MQTDHYDLCRGLQDAADKDCRHVLAVGSRLTGAAELASRPRCCSKDGSKTSVCCKPAQAKQGGRGGSPDLPTAEQTEATQPRQRKAVSSTEKTICVLQQRVCCNSNKALFAKGPVAAL